VGEGKGKWVEWEDEALMLGLNNPTVVEVALCEVVKAAAVPMIPTFPQGGRP